ncbi:MAG: formylglycine-generating enzyme family protein [Planctomycetes bacterium]|nr:formylglycine-generating enzyme family protein [Planctomycetota bacterium]
MSEPPAGMLAVPAGDFLGGTLRERRSLDAFWIDRTPVTNREFAIYARATGARAPSYFAEPGFLDRKGDHPVVGVSLFQALAYALWAGKDLPTEEEWEKACRGTDGRRYPWGARFDPSLCNTAVSDRRDTTPVAAFPGGASPYGVLDLCGNCWEWTRTTAPEDERLALVKGGSWFDPPGVARGDGRFTARPNFVSATLGFRCVWRPGTPFRTIPGSFRYAYVPPTPKRRPLQESPGEWADLIADVEGRELDLSSLGDEGSLLREWDVDAALAAAEAVLGSDEDELRTKELEALLAEAEQAFREGRGLAAEKALERYAARGGTDVRARELTLRLGSGELALRSFAPAFSAARVGPWTLLALVLVNLVLLVVQWLL